MSTELAVIQKTEPAALVAPPRTAFAAITFADMQQMAKYVSDSKMFGQLTVPEAMTLMLLAQSEGIHPMDGIRRYHLMKGKPVMRADAMLAAFQAKGGTLRYLRHDDECVIAVMSHPLSGELEIKWDMKRAAKAQVLNSNGGTWQKFPCQMLTARVVSEGVRALLPGVTVGIYTPEEAEAFSDPDPKQRYQQHSAPAVAATAEPVIEGEVVEPTPSHSTPPQRRPNPLREEFDAVAIANRLEFANGIERGAWLNRCMDRPDDSREPLTDEDYRHAIKKLPSVIAAERARRQREAGQAMPTQARPTPSTPSQPIQRTTPEPPPIDDMAFDDDEFRDPFAEDTTSPYAGTGVPKGSR